MIKLTFLTAQRKVIKFDIAERVVKYFDDMWKDGIQILPSQTPEMKLMLKKMILSRKPAVQSQATFIIDANSGKNKEEYDSCKTDEDIAEIIKREAKTKGLLELK